LEITAFKRKSYAWWYPGWLMIPLHLLRASAVKKTFFVSLVLIRKKQPPLPGAACTNQLVTAVAVRLSAKYNAI
jgi:hypothetical protein